MLTTFVLLSVVTATILDTFDTLANLDPNLVSAHDLALFGEGWAALDPEAKYRAPVSELPSLLMALPPPLGLKGQPFASHSKAVKICLGLKVQITDGHVTFLKEIASAGGGEAPRSSCGGSGEAVKAGPKPVTSLREGHVTI